MVELVIFDMDGVLVDSEMLACSILRQHLAEAGTALSLEEVVRTFVGFNAEATREICRRRFAISDANAFYERFMQAVHDAFPERLKPMPYVAEAIEGLGRPVCVASSSSPETIELSLRLTGLARYFGDNTFSSHMVARGKPHPDLFLLAAGQMGVRPDQAAVVEDSLPGIAAGRAAGMRVLAYAGGAHVDPAAQAATGAEVFKDMRDLPRLLAAG